MSSLLLSLVAAALVPSLEAVRTLSQTSASGYEAFRSEFGVERAVLSGTEAYLARVALFERRQAEVKRHNAQPGITWTAAVNKFADFTEAEFQAMLGHRPTNRARRAAASFMQLRSPQQLATSVDWNAQLNSSKQAKDQGGCGSCWAVAAAGALETHAEIAAKGPVPEVSYEQLVDCVENPEACGGSGGCNGATSELAFDYAVKHGLVAKADYKGYQSQGSGTCVPPTNPIIATQGFVRLDVNKLQPLLEAVSTQGPVVVSSDASDWGSYSAGVFDGCDKDAVINHAILAMGYGTDTTLKRDYWLIRNSWGPEWGEKGYIRMLRHAADEGDDGYCGTDHAPLDGVGCKGGPATLPVCGMCGVLSDSAYPTGVSASQTDAQKKLV